MSEVKTLQWFHIKDDQFAGGVTALADTPFGQYQAWGSGLFKTPFDMSSRHEGSLDTAIASCQASFDALVRSCLREPSQADPALPK